MQSFNNEVFFMALTQNIWLEKMKTSNAAATGESLITGKSLLRFFFFVNDFNFQHQQMLVRRFVKKNSFDRQQQNVAAYRNLRARIIYCRSSFFIICMSAVFPVALLSRYYDKVLPPCFAELRTFIESWWKHPETSPV